MGAFEKVIVWIGLALCAFYALASEFLDIIGRLEIVEKKWPKVHSAMSNRPMRLVLIVFLIVLAGRDLSDRLAIHVPPLSVTVEAPPPPTVEMGSSTPRIGEGLMPIRPAPAPLPIEHLTLLQEDTNSTHADSPYAKRITIQSTILENVVALNLWFDSPLSHVEDLSRMEEGMFWEGGIEIAKGEPRCVVVEFNAPGIAMLRPDRPIIFRVESSSPIRFVKWLRKGDSGSWQELPKALQ